MPACSNGSNNCCLGVRHSLQQVLDVFAGKSSGHALHCKTKRKAWLPSIKSGSQNSKIAEATAWPGQCLSKFAEQEVWCWRAHMKLTARMQSIQLQLTVAPSMVVSHAVYIGYWLA